MKPEEKELDRQILELMGSGMPESEAAVETTPIEEAVIPASEPETKTLARVLRTPDMVSPQTYEELRKFCDDLVHTGFMPNQLDTGAKVLAVVLTGRELGIPMMASTRTIYVSKENRLGLHSEMMLALFGRAGGRWQWLRDGSDGKNATLKLVKPSGDEHVQTFTIDDAEAAGLLVTYTDDRGHEKQARPNWFRYRANMLRARAISAGVRAFAPDVTSGLYTPDELEDIREQEPAVRPLKAQTKPTAEHKQLLYRVMNHHVWSDQEREDAKQWLEGPERTSEEVTAKIVETADETGRRRRVEKQKLAADPVPAAAEVQPGGLSG